MHSLSEGRQLTFAELLDQVEAVRRALADVGIGRGSCVASLVGNRPLFFPIVAACLDLGAALLPIGEATDTEATAMLEEAGAAAVITDRQLPVASIRNVPLPDGVRALRLADRPLPPAYGESVVLKLTSGSTDLPRAALANEQHLINDGRHIIDAMDIGSTDVNLTYIPLSHSYAIGNVVMPLLLQGTAVALRPSFSPSQFVHDVDASGATVFPGVPFMFAHIRELPQIDRLPPRLRLLVTAGARIDPATVIWFRDRLNRKVHSFYGSSETGGIAYDDSDDVADPLDVGRAMPETRVEIRSETGAGPIFVAGNAVVSGYAPAGRSDPVSPFRDGGFLTGDIGYLDGENRVVLTGRRSPLVNIAGRKVDPAEVERVLAGLPGIVDARVLGVSCARRGQELVAFVVRSHSALTPIAIRQRCAGTLSPYKIPRRFIFIDQLPIDARGKIDRRALEALAADSRDA